MGPDLKAIARHSASVLAGQLAVMAFGVTDTLIAGRYSDTALAALSVGTAIYVSVFVSLIGVMQATLPVWAELLGARRDHDIGHSVQQSLYLCALAVAAGMAVLWWAQPLLNWTDVPAALQGEVLTYLQILAFALAPALLFRLYANLNQALGRPLLVTWLQVGSLALKVPLSTWLAFGGLGLEAQGLAGCAWATLVVNYAMLAVAVWMLRVRRVYAPLSLFSGMVGPEWRYIGRLARLGVPGGLAVLVEVTSFTLMALFIARQGDTASASHQIAANLATLLYMVPLSLGIATSARVSHRLGAGQPDMARQAVWAGYALACGTATVLSVTLLLASASLPLLYSQNTAVVAGAAVLLKWVALYHAMDTLQALSVFILRCYRVTLLPLVIYCVLLWGVGLAGGYGLAYVGLSDQVRPWQSPVAFWVTSAAALTCVAALFVGLVAHATRRPPH